MADDFQEAENRLLAAYYSIFNTPEGKIVLADLEGEYYRRTFVSRPLDSTAIIMSAGAREVIVRILMKIEEFELQQRSR